MGYAEGVLRGLLGRGRWAGTDLLMGSTASGLLSSAEVGVAVGVQGAGVEEGGLGRGVVRAPAAPVAASASIIAELAFIILVIK